MNIETEEGIKILGVEWIGGRTTIGIVCIENQIGKRSARIATVAGFDSKADAMHVADWGSRLSYAASIAFFPTLITKENFK